MRRGPVGGRHRCPAGDRRLPRHPCCPIRQDRSRPPLSSYLREVLEKKGRKLALIPSFEYALQKYDLDGGPPKTSGPSEFVYYIATGAIFALVATQGFSLL